MPDKDSSVARRRASCPGHDGAATRPPPRLTVGRGTIFSGCSGDLPPAQPHGLGTTSGAALTPDSPSPPGAGRREIRQEPPTTRQSSTWRCPCAPTRCARARVRAPPVPHRDRHPFAASRGRSAPAAGRGRLPPAKPTCSICGAPNGRSEGHASSRRRSPAHEVNTCSSYSIELGDRFFGTAPGDAPVPCGGRRAVERGRDARRGRDRRPAADIGKAGCREVRSTTAAERCAGARSGHVESDAPCSSTSTFPEGPGPDIRHHHERYDGRAIRTVFAGARSTGAPSPLSSLIASKSDRPPTGIPGVVRRADPRGLAVRPEVEALHPRDGEEVPHKGKRDRFRFSSRPQRGLPEPSELRLINDS